MAADDMCACFLSDWIEWALTFVHGFLLALYLVCCGGTPLFPVLEPA